MGKSTQLPLGRLIGIGLVLWFVATLAFRLFGQFLLVPEQPLRTMAVFAVAFPLMYVLMNAVLRAQRLDGQERVVAATAILAPACCWMG